MTKSPKKETHDHPLHHTALIGLAIIAGSLGLVPALALDEPWLLPIAPIAYVTTLQSGRPIVLWLLDGDQDDR